VPLLATGIIIVLVYGESSLDKPIGNTASVHFLQPFWATPGVEVGIWTRHRGDNQTTQAAATLPADRGHASSSGSEEHNDDELDAGNSHKEVAAASDEVSRLRAELDAERLRSAKQKAELERLQNSVEIVQPSITATKAALGVAANDGMPLADVKEPASTTLYIPSSLWRQPPDLNAPSPARIQKETSTTTTLTASPPPQQPALAQVVSLGLAPGAAPVVVTATAAPAATAPEAVPPLAASAQAAAPNEHPEISLKVGGQEIRVQIAHVDSAQTPQAQTPQTAPVSVPAPAPVEAIRAQAAPAPPAPSVAAEDVTRPAPSPIPLAVQQSAGSASASHAATAGATKEQEQLASTLAGSSDAVSAATQAPPPMETVTTTSFSATADKDKGALLASDSTDGAKHATSITLKSQGQTITIEIGGGSEKKPAPAPSPTTESPVVAPAVPSPAVASQEQPSVASTAATQASLPEPGVSGSLGPSATAPQPTATVPSSKGLATTKSPTKKRRKAAPSQPVSEKVTSPPAPAVPVAAVLPAASPVPAVPAKTVAATVPVAAPAAVTVDKPAPAAPPLHLPKPAAEAERLPPKTDGAPEPIGSPPLKADLPASVMLTATAKPGPSGTTVPVPPMNTVVQVTTTPVAELLAKPEESKPDRFANLALRAR